MTKIILAVVLTLAALSRPSPTMAQHMAQERTPPPQTARQALIEMLTGGEKAGLKHMTVEAQQALAAQKTTSFIAGGPLAMLGAFKGQAGGDFQAFDSGPVLFSIVEKNDHSKVEIRLDSDDLNGPEDTMQISVHQFRDGAEQEEDQLQLFSPEIQVTLKQQENIWRLNEVRVSATFPLGDAQFVKKMLGQGTAAKASEESHSTVAVSASLAPNAEARLDASQIVMMLGFAENTFASLHPEAGFTCSLSELVQDRNVVGIDAQVAAGPYNGYKFALAGCEGKPAGSFQITAEPFVAGAGKAYCTDATHNVRVADDGRGGTCLSAGKMQNQITPSEGEGGMSGFAIYRP